MRKCCAIGTTGQSMKKLLIITLLLSTGLFQSCTQARSQAPNTPNLVTIKHKALRHDEVRKRISMGYATDYRLESAVSSCSGDDCVTTLVFVYTK